MDIQNLSRRDYLEALLKPAEPKVMDLGDVIIITMHNYRSQIASMITSMKVECFRLVSVVRVEHQYCSDSGREFWWIKEELEPTLNLSTATSLFNQLYPIRGK